MDSGRRVVMSARVPMLWRCPESSFQAALPQQTDSPCRLKTALRKNHPVVTMLPGIQRHVTLLQSAHLICVDQRLSAVKRFCTSSSVGSVYFDSGFLMVQFVHVRCAPIVVKSLLLPFAGFVGFVVPILHRNQL